MISEGTFYKLYFFNSSFATFRKKKPYWNSPVNSWKFPFLEVVNKLEEKYFRTWRAEICCLDAVQNPLVVWSFDFGGVRCRQKCWKEPIFGHAFFMLQFRNSCWFQETPYNSSTDLCSTSSGVAGSNNYWLRYVFALDLSML